MNFLLNIFRLIWRIWFYGVFLMTIIVIFPVLIIVTSSDKFYPIFFSIARAWAKTILFLMGFKAKTDYQEKIHPKKSYMFIANHTSMIDIMLMFVVAKNPFVFVGKKELTKVPIFGYIFRRTCILVDRSCNKSRREVYFRAQKRLKDGVSICIFPEGKVPDDESIVLDVFQNGAFRLAIEHQIPIIPISFYDCKRLFSFTFFSGKPGTLRSKVHPFIDTTGLTLKDREVLKKQSFDLLHNDLLADLAKH
ncbi:MAG: 1-acyl-sn-glycerol-3-phosphate acyltransferase [Flavobacteriaceae bacterium]|nr:1-acyl-sn-glycerol-3-phosphate acyltransferase [Flavobacteriaceae bacterium]